MDSKKVAAVFPVSPCQEALLLTGGDSLAQECCEISWRLNRELDFGVFEKAWRQVISRHEILRTSFAWKRVSKPLQAVWHEVELTIHQEDWCDERGIDPSQAPLFRLSLLKPGDESYQLVLSHHRLLLDRRSVSLIFEEVLSYYDAFRHGESLELAPARPYREYIAWLQQQDQKAAEQYWREQLRGVTETTQLGLERGKSNGETAVELVELSEADTQALEQLANEKQLTFSAVVQGAWAVLLSRYSGKQDVIYGVEVSGRPAGMETMLGSFANVLPVRVQVSGQQTVLQLLQELTAAQVRRQQYEYVSALQVQEWSEVGSEQPLFESACLNENHASETKYGLTLAAREGRALEVSLQYQSGRYAAETVRQMLAQLLPMLESMVARPEQRISELEWLTADERRQLKEWNATRREYKGHASVVELFEAQVDLQADAVAVEFEGEQLTYAELNERATSLAHYLRSLGVGPEVRVGICLERSVEMVVSVLGIVKAGGAYVPLESTYPEERLKYMAADAGVAVLLTHRRLAAPFAETNARIVCLEEEWSTIETTLCGHPSLDTLAYVIYTSGSTGLPKGVQITHDGLRNLVQWHLEKYQVNNNDHLTQVATFGFDAAVWEIWPSLCGGATLHVCPEHVRLDPQALQQWLEREAITQTFLPTPLAEKVLALRWNTKSSLRVLLTGGDRLQRWADASHTFELVNHYGPTESTVVTSCATVPTEATGSAPSIGKPINNTEVYVLGNTQQLVPIGVKGELYVGGGQLARGYLGRAELTAERFTPHPFSDEAGARLYRTGDVVRYLSDGNLEYLGRADSQVKIRGHRIELGEIEATLSAHPDIRQAVVITHNAENQERLVAYVVSTNGTGSSEWREYLQQRLPEYMVPAVFVSLPGLPLTANGKVDRRSLPEPEWKRTRHFVPPVTDAERVLCAIWSELLGVKEVGVEDNYFELGGDSILSIQIIARAHQAGLRLKPRDMFAHQTVRALASVAEVGEQLVRGEQGEVDGAVMLTPIQQWFFEEDLSAKEHYNHAVLLRVRELKPEWLREAVMGLVRQHDALRLRFARNAEAWASRIAPVADGAEQESFTHYDLASLSHDEQRQAITKTAGELQRSLKLETGPIVRVSYFNLGDEGARLLIIIHHLAVDGVSWRILLEDLQRGYEQVSRGETISLGAKSTSWREWGEQLQRYVAEGKLAGEEEYWLRATQSEPNRADRRGLVGESEQVVVRLAAHETRELLQEVPRLYGTQITEVLLWALVQALGEQRLIVEIEGHGREELEGAAATDLTRTVGWFTTMYPLALTVDSATTCATGLKQVQEQVRAVPQRGIGYGLLKYLSPNEELRRQLREGARARVSFNYLGQLDTVVRTGSMFQGANESIGNGRSELNERHHELEVNGSIRGGELLLTWTYSRAQHERAEIETTAERYTHALRQLLKECRAERTQRGYSTADFPLARLDGATLARVVGESRDIEDIYPLTPLQQGMLFHSLFEPGNAVGYEQVSCRLEGELNPAAFARAWQAVVQRHTILRTAFVWEGVPEPLQVVQREVELPITHEDWRDQEQRLDEYLQAERERGIDLNKAPLMRLSLLRLKDESHQLVWSHHHLLLDGWCVSLIFKEVLSYYDAFRKGEQLELTPARPYRDYIAWLQRQDQQAAEQYWREQLRGFTETTQLRLERGRSNGETAVEWAGLSEAATQAWEQLAREHQLTLSAVVQGAWAMLLSQYSDKQDVVYGVTVSGRPPELAGVETMLGMFINVLPVRVQVNKEQTVLQWLQELTAAQFRRQQYEYVSGLQVQEWSEVGMGQPLFESLCLYENYPLERSGGELERAGLRLEGLRSGIKTKYGLTIAARKGRVLELSLLYQSGRYEAKTMRHVLAQLQRTLEDWVARPEQRVGELECLTAEERRQLLEEWSAARDAEAETSDEFALTPTEELLKGIWSEVLGAQRAGVDHNFFDMGGHSLLATQLISRVRQLFQIELPLRTLFEAPTIRTLAARVDTVLQSGALSNVPPLKRVSRDEAHPLSFAQQRLWFLAQLEPDNAFYNSPLAVRLKGELQLPALEQTLRELVRRHEVLRTSFVSEQGKPRQVIGSVESVPLEVVELSEEQVREFAAREAAQPFDLSHGPLLRVKVLRLSEQEHVLLLTMHHIVSDGWSMGVLIREVSELYSAYVSGREPELPELPIQYVDYASWQREWLQGETLDEQLQYWREQLAGAPPVLDLPADRGRPAVQTFRGGHERFALSEEVSMALKDLSRREGVTMFMLLLAAFQLLLMRYSGSEDIVVGTALANRTRRELEGLIGFFINMLPIRTDLGGDPSFSELLKRVREVCLGAYTHQDMPFDKLVEELQPRRDERYSPFFQVAFGIQNAPKEVLDLPGLQLSSMIGEPENVRFDLTLWVLEKPNALNFLWTYNAELFESTTVRTMAEQLGRLLGSIVQDPAAPLSALEMLSDAEKSERERNAKERVRFKQQRFAETKPVPIRVSTQPSA